MPVYVAKCKVCEHEQDYIRKIADIDDVPECEECAGEMSRIIVGTMLPSMGIADHFSMISPLDGSRIHGRSEYYAHMKKHNVVPASDLAGEPEHQKKQIEKKQKQERRETIAKVYEQLKN